MAADADGIRRRVAELRFDWQGRVFAVNSSIGVIVLDNTLGSVGDALSAGERLLVGAVADELDAEHQAEPAQVADDFTVAHSGTHDALVPPRTLMAVRPTGTVTGDVYAFVAKKLPNGATRFTWPEDLQ